MCLFFFFQNLFSFQTCTLQLMDDPRQQNILASLKINLNINGRPAAMFSSFKKKKQQKQKNKYNLLASLNDEPMRRGCAEILIRTHEHFLSKFTNRMPKWKNNQKLYVHCCVCNASCASSAADFSDTDLSFVWYSAIITLIVSAR